VFTLDPLLHAGCYYVQEASSMLIEQAFLQSGLHDRDLLALDLCAAPGGKSTHLASLLSPGSFLVCNEPVPARQAALSENLWKHGRPSVAITGTDPARLDGLEGFFDLILVDAPCSGEGMFRKDPFAREQWNEGLVTSCARTQQRILDHAWRALAPGGVLIYSTCTWERAENEEQVISLLNAGGEWQRLQLDPAWGVETTDAGHRCYPHRVKGEGFFISVVRKPGTPVARSPLAQENAQPVEWLEPVEQFTLWEQENVRYAQPVRWSAAIRSIADHLRIVAPGQPHSDRKGERWRPHAALALSTALDAGSMSTLDVDRRDALAFLRGELPSSLNGRSNGPPAERVQLVRYDGHALGWLHAAGDRWNNGWPAAWRIRMR
jgi:SAM-dependent methyltransferase